MKPTSWLLGGIGLLSAVGGVLLFQQQANQLGQAAAAIKPASTDSQRVQASAALFAQQLNDADGKAQALAQWRGRPLVVNFWAPWCAPCVKEMPVLVKLQQDFAAKNLQVIGIGMDNPTAIAEFRQQHKISFPLLVGGVEASELARGLGNQAGALPFTVVIDKDGKVLKTYTGLLHFEQFYTELQIFFGGLAAAGKS